MQEIFLEVWRNADHFDPERGTVRSWVLQIAHFRLLNELRRRSRRPEIVPDPGGLVLAGQRARRVPTPVVTCAGRRLRGRV